MVFSRVVYLYSEISKIVNKYGRKTKKFFDISEFEVKIRPLILWAALKKFRIFQGKNMETKNRFEVKSATSSWTISRVFGHTLHKYVSKTRVRMTFEIFLSTIFIRIQWPYFKRKIDHALENLDGFLYNSNHFRPKPYFVKKKCTVHDLHLHFQMKSHFKLFL